MLSLFILLFAFSFLWSVNQRLKGRFLTPSGLLLTVYLLCSVGTLYLYRYDEVVLDPLATTYYVVALGTLLLPVVMFDETHSVTTDANDTEIEVYISYFLVVVGVFSVAYNFSDMASALNGDLDENRRWTTSEANQVVTIPSVLAAYAAYLFSLMVPLGFYWLATRRRSLLGTALLAGSCSYLVFVLRHVGRDVLVMWGSAFAFNMLLFWRNLSGITKVIMLVGYSVALLILGVLFLLITSDRFSTEKTGYIYPYANYAGQSPVHFSEHFLASRPLGYGQLNFNIVYRLGALAELTEYNRYFTEDAVAYTMSSENYFLNVFSSIVGSFFQDFGKYGTVLFVACLGIVMCVTLGRGGRRLPLWQVIIYTMYMQVMLGGAFYYFYYHNVGNCALAFSVGTAVAIKYARGYRRKLEISEAFARERNGGVTTAL